MDFQKVDTVAIAKNLKNEGHALDIPGISYVPDYLLGEEEAELIQIVDAQPWMTDLKRRVQHYGYRYDYKARGLTSDLYLGAVPPWLQPYCRRLITGGYFSQIPDQVIINEYLPGQGIALHTDCIPCFGDVIASISLGSHCLMDFTNAETKASLCLESRSLLVLSGEARYQWKHGIAARKSDKVDDTTVPRKRRLSLTFRTVIPQKRLISTSAFRADKLAPVEI